MIVLDKDLRIRRLRELRSKECFPIINRGPLWYNSLTSTQRVQLKKWYEAWLNVTQTLIIPDKLSWIDDKIKLEEQTW